MIAVAGSARPHASSTTMARSPDVLISAEQIAVRTQELADAIARDHDPAHELLLVGVLKGAFIFLADLARALSVPNAVDFMAVSSYGHRGTDRGALRLIMDLREDVRGRAVVIVEDIVDSGHTVAYLQRELRTRGPASVRTCALVTKPSRREVEVAIDYVGFEIPDAWVVGYGLDYKDRYRTLPYIGVIDPEQS